MKKINIYLTENEKNEFHTIQNKYKISMSTIADKICFYFYKQTIHNPMDVELCNKLQNEYIQFDKTGKIIEGYKKEERRSKTSIIPKCFNEKDGIMYYNIKNPNKSIYITNVMYLYITKQLDKYITKKGLQIFYNDINTEFSKTREQFWNYNNAVRNQTRAVRQNKDYYRRIVNE